MSTIIIDGIEYEEQVIELKDLNEDDLVLSGNEWKKQEPFPEQDAEEMYRIWFNDGFEKQYIECDGYHEWTLFLKDKNKITLETREIFFRLDLLKDFTVGNLEGLKIDHIEEISNLDESGNPIKVRCIQLQDSEDSLFSVKTKNDEGKESWDVLTHNCTLRAAAGRLAAVPSRMLFDNQRATTISENPGAALIRANSIYLPTQVYFRKDHQWLLDWFAARGLDERGYDNKSGEYGPDHDPENIDLGEDEEIQLNKVVTEIEFNDIKAEIDNTKNQKFEEV